MMLSPRSATLGTDVDATMAIGGQVIEPRSVTVPDMVWSLIPDVDPLKASPILAWSFVAAYATPELLSRYCLIQNFVLIGIEIVTLSDNSVPPSGIVPLAEVENLICVNVPAGYSTLAVTV